MLREWRSQKRAKVVLLLLLLVVVIVVILLLLLLVVVVIVILPKAAQCPESGEARRVQKLENEAMQYSLHWNIIVIYFTLEMP